MARTVQGVCKLTGKVGPFVDAHILPKALTYPAERGLPFAQAGSNYPPIKRWSSWYDPQIVTRDGEDILAAYDDWGIAELRKHRLIWRSWGPMQALVTGDHYRIGASAYGLRSIVGVDGLRLRLFLLSLLWRAGVSRMGEFHEVDISEANLERLRKMLVDQDPYPLDFYSVTLTQLSTTGPIHNLAPLAQDMPLSILEPDRTVPIFRFYLDGLVAHFYRDIKAEDLAIIADRQVGLGATLRVTTVSFEVSWQRENLNELMREAFTRWPERMSKIPGFFPEDLT